jgi:hypothetical protein
MDELVDVFLSFQAEARLEPMFPDAKLFCFLY